MTKVLYFEGVGVDFYSEEQTNYSDVGNFRIRTAFKNLDGKQIYIEMGNCIRHDWTNKKPKKITDFALRIDHLFEIVHNNGSDDENKTGIVFNWKSVQKLNYTKQDITKWINENLNCDFDTIQVLDFFYGYRVHGEGRTYNFMEDIELNHARATARKEQYNKVDLEYREYLNEKYSKIGLFGMDSESITIRCHASDQALKDKPRVQKIAVSY